MPEFRTLEEYAAHVRRETLGLMVTLSRTLGPEHRAALAAGRLCTEAATIVQQAKMQEEVGDPGRYDLGALPVPSLASEEEE